MHITVKGLHRFRWMPCPLASSTYRCWTAAHQVSMHQLNQIQQCLCDGTGTIAGNAESNILPQGSIELWDQASKSLPSIDQPGMLACSNPAACTQSHCMCTHAMPFAWQVSLKGSGNRQQNLASIFFLQLHIVPWSLQ